ncbi:hypothetical protein ACJJTC_013410 [Scirpophaga incertulas]
MISIIILLNLLIFRQSVEHHLKGIPWVGFCVPGCRLFRNRNINILRLLRRQSGEIKNCFVTNLHNKQDKNQEWILVGMKKQKNRFTGHRGKAVADISCKFKAADVKVPMYIYNISKETSATDIVSYIEKKAIFTASLEKIDIHADKGYDAYKVYVSRNKLELLMKEDFWPNGIARKFYEFSKKKTDSAQSLKRDFKINSNG